MHDLFCCKINLPKWLLQKIIRLKKEVKEWNGTNKSETEISSISKYSQFYYN